jgi:large-conductance mechanosensitive channel
MKKAIVFYILVIVAIQLPFVVFSYHEDIKTNWVYSPMQLVIIDQKQVHKKIESYIIDREIIINAEGEPELVMYADGYFDSVINWRWNRFARVNDFLKEHFRLYGSHYKYSLIHLIQYVLWAFLLIVFVVHFNKKRNTKKSVKHQKEANQQKDESYNKDNLASDVHSPVRKSVTTQTVVTKKETESDEVDLSFFDPKDE